MVLKIYIFVKKNILSVVKQYRPFFKFIFRFLLFYILVSFVYKLYLDSYTNGEIDGITMHVVKQVERSFVFLGHTIHLKVSEVDPAVEIYYKERCVARMIEGCNGISITLLFFAFIFAFAAKFKKTLVYMLIGGGVIYLLNILRISFLVYGVYYYPNYQFFFHDIFFPIVIYGTVVLLWLIWIFKISGHVQKRT